MRLDTSLQFGTHGNVMEAFRNNKHELIHEYMKDHNLESIRVWSDGCKSYYMHTDGTFSAREFHAQIGDKLIAEGKTWAEVALI